MTGTHSDDPSSARSACTAGNDALVAVCKLTARQVSDHVCVRTGKEMSEGAPRQVRQKRGPPVCFLTSIPPISSCRQSGSCSSSLSADTTRSHSCERWRTHPSVRHAPRVRSDRERIIDEQQHEQGVEGDENLPEFAVRPVPPVRREDDTELRRVADEADERERAADPDASEQLAHLRRGRPRSRAVCLFCSSTVVAGYLSDSDCAVPSWWSVRSDRDVRVALLVLGQR